MKILNKDLFILVIGHARSGTSLCAGLLNEVSEINIGLEINNFGLTKRTIWIKDIFPEGFTGNKICIFQGISYNRIIESIENKKCIMHDDWKRLKIIFTKRNIISNMVSKKFREEGKGNSIPSMCIVKDYALFEKKIIKLKKYFNDYFVFDFDKAISNWEYVGEMFKYVGALYKKRYFTEFKNIKNYNYGKGVKSEFVQFGMVGKYEEERKEFEQLIQLYEPWLMKNEKNY